MKSTRERFYPLTVLLFTLGYTSYLLAKILFMVVGLPAFILLTPFPGVKQRLLQNMTRRFLAFFTRGWLPFLDMYEIAEISGLERAQSVSPAVYVANHRGYMDAILMLGLCPRTGVLIKSNHARQPMYNMLVRHFDLVSVDRHTLSSLSGSLDRCRRILDQGKNMLVFPEGTRARSGRLQPFNRVAFDLATSARVPVVPVVIHSTQPFMAKVPGSIFPRGRCEYHIRFLDPEMPQPDDDASSLCDRVYRRMARELKELDVGTIWEIKPPKNE